MLTEEQLKKGFVLGDCEVLHDKGVISRNGEEIHPEPLVWRVLLSIARRDGDLVSKDDIIEDAWDGRAVADDPINRAIAGVRHALGDKARPHEYLETLQRRGYRLLKPVELPEPPASEPDDHELRPGVQPSSRLWRFVALLLAAGLVAITVMLWPAGSDVRSIAVMPFDNHTGAESNDYIAAGFKEVLVRSLSGIQGITVKNGRLRYDEEDEQVRKALDVDSVLRASLTRTAEVLTLNYTIFQRGQGVVFSGKVQGGFDEQFSLQESLAVMVRRDLIGKSEQTLFKSRSSDSKAYNSYMRGAYLLELRGAPGNLELAIELLAEAIRLDGSFGPSYLALATAYALLPEYRSEPIEESNRLALATVEKGVAADPGIEDAAGSIYGFVYHKEKRWRASEDAHLRAINAEVVDSNAFNWYSRMLASVGRLDASLDLALEAVKIDPSSALMNSRVAIAYTWLEDSVNADRYFARSTELGADGTTYILAHAFLLLREGQWDKASELTHGAVQVAETSDDWVDPLYAGLADPQHAAAALQALDKVEEAGELSYQVSFVARTVLGDVDGAMRIAQMLQLPGEVFEMDLLFVPAMQPLREHPDFMPLLEQLGITDYWAGQGCTWTGDRVRCSGD